MTANAPSNSSKTLYGVLTCLVTTPVLTGIGSSLVAKYGHTFGLIAKTGLLHAGIFGVIQTVFSVVLATAIQTAAKGTKYEKICEKWSIIAANIFVGSLLFVISLQAAKVGIIATGITFSAAALLTLANYCMSTALMLGFAFIGSKYQLVDEV